MNKNQRNRICCGCCVLRGERLCLHVSCKQVVLYVSCTLEGKTIFLCSDVRARVKLNLKAHSSVPCLLLLRRYKRHCAAFVWRQRSRPQASQQCVQRFASAARHQALFWEVAAASRAICQRHRAATYASWLLPPLRCVLTPPLLHAQTCVREAS